MTSMESSLSNLLGSEPETPHAKESMTVSTEDSRHNIDKKKRTKRGGKKKSKSSGKDSLGSSLNELADSSSTSYCKESPTVLTEDSLQQKTPEAKVKKNKRGGKKKKPVELETSLTELLTDEDDEPSYVKETLTLHARNSPSKSPKSKSKKPVKKPQDLGSVLGRLDAPKDFGRGEDDNDTFCGLGTVGDNETPHLKAKIVKSPTQRKSKTSRGNAMMMPKDDSDSEEEDLFESFDSNPFRLPY